MPSNPTTPSSGWEPPSLEHLHELLPQYEITEMLGRGGMGAVYKGRQTKLNRDVAIKLLPETFTEGDDELNFAKRFEQEAQSMANLDHPAIISVYDFGETDEGQLYFVMEFVDGLDIHKYLHQYGGKLPQEHALSITAHVLDALDYAHQHGIIHRDIKPANILLNREGRVKIADFGLAKRASGPDDGPALTMTNMAIGTPDFVAPEALNPDKTPDHRADLYAVGVMLYQMLTGELPRGQFKMPSRIDQTLDPRLDEIIDQALQSDPDDRYSSASQIRSAIDPIVSSPITRVEGAQQGSEGEPVSLDARDVIEGPKKKSQIPLMIGLGAAALLLVGGLIWMTSGGGEGTPDPVLVENSAPADLTPLPSTPAKSSAPKAETRKQSSAPREVTDQVSPAPHLTTTPTQDSKEETKPEPEAPTNSTPSIAVVSPAQSEEEPSETASTPPPPTNESETGSSVDYAAIPDLFLKLNRYHAARSSQMGSLAASYLRALEGRLNQAADAGDLKLATAYQGEKDRVLALQDELKNQPSTPVEALAQLPDLEALPSSSPDPLTSLRQTWTLESDKIDSTLDQQLQKSLLLLEQDLTKARDFDNAGTVLALRESLLASTAARPPSVALMPPPTAVATTTEPNASPARAPGQELQGRIRAKGLFKGGKPIDLTKAEPYDDFVQLSYNRNGFIARRVGGELVTNFNLKPDPPVMIREIIPNASRGYDGLIGLIDLDGKLTLHRATDKSLPILPELGEIKSVALMENVALTVMNDGTLRWWGKHFQSDAG
ncbi:MAG: protein kinase, partial [Verrucomicrobiota bacterium]